MPVPQHRFERSDTSGRADLNDQRSDLIKQVAASPKLVDKERVTHVGRAVNPVSGQRVAARLEQTGAFPLAQRGRKDAEPSGQRADEGVAAFLRHRTQIAQRGLDGFEGASVIEKLGVAFVDKPQRVLNVAAVDRLHDH